MFMRHPGRGLHSIEGVFGAVRRHLPKDIHVDFVVLDQPSRGLLPRLRNAAQAWRLRGEVNHVTGDVHYLTLALPRDNTLLTVHDLRGLLTKSGLRRLILEIFWYRLPVQRAGTITAISDFTAESLRERYPGSREKIVTVPDPIDDAFFDGGDMSEGGRDPQRTSRSVLLIGTKENKNLPRVFEATHGLDLELTIIGHLSESQKEKLRASKTDFISRTDLSQHEVIDCYKNSSVLLFPSLYEGFGMPIVEAQALGIPVITSDREPMRSVAGGAAVLVDPEDPEAIRQALIRVFDDPDLRLSLVNAGRENAQRFHPATIASQYADLYHAVVRGDVT